MNKLTWVEVSKNSLAKNIDQFKRMIGPEKKLCVCVKGNAYGHGVVEASKELLSAGVDWLGVNALYEARAIRQNGIKAPIYVLGYVGLDSLAEALKLDTRLVVYNKEALLRLNEEAEKLNLKARVHIKVETGNNRQGVNISDLENFVNEASSLKNIFIEGISSHFANIEDTTDHTYAKNQLRLFEEAIAIAESVGGPIPYKHFANSAATMLFNSTHFSMVRVGISAYGMWPSKETYASLLQKGINVPKLYPVLSWKARIAQIKKVDSGESIGYGCTYKTGRDSMIAIVPIGYYDGYDRKLSNKAYVLINGQRAPVRGRICMNIIMVDVTDIGGVELEGTVTLIGKDAEEEISAELFASWADTINYEVTTRINERIPRIYI
ncbi:alanine racemase [Candidatus Peregrinibacteria bacterium]|nr:alanine racemase [Candidatus Peregrinibacteria bacterium]